MEMIFSFVALIFFVAILAAVVLFCIFLARKVGILPQKDASEVEAGTPVDSIKTRNFSWQSIKDSLLFRFGVIAVLTLLMTTPLELIRGIVYERSGLYDSVVREIAQTWGYQQNISGPVLLVPYTEQKQVIETVTDKNGDKRNVRKTITSHSHAIALPDELRIDAQIENVKKYRSIYEALVYKADLAITGQFSRPNVKGLSSDIVKVHWDKAWLTFGISDTQAIQSTSALKWNQQQVDFEPGTRITNIIENGFHAPLSIDNKDTFTFDLSIALNGSELFYFEPYGKTTITAIEADWPHPSFQGSVLPQQHDINSEGFSAQWQVPHLARNYPQLWSMKNSSFNIHEFSAGVQLFEPVSLYSQILRASKYGILFIALTYLTLLIFELGIKQRLHWIQYGIIGAALSLFYLSLLSLSEHIQFLPAYLISSGIIIAMICAYVYASLRNFSRVGIVAILLIALYTLFYSLLKLEDYALLVGTVLLLVILGVMMYLTRNAGAQNQPVEPEQAQPSD